MSDTHGTTHATRQEALILRGKPIELQPLTLEEMQEVRDSLVAIIQRPPDADPLGPEIMEHLLNVIAVAVRQQIPDIQREEVAEAVNAHVLRESLQALSGSKSSAPPIYVAAEGNA